MESKMLTLEELHAHYKAVRSRIENPVKKAPAVRLVYPEPAPYPDPLDFKPVEAPPPVPVTAPAEEVPNVPETPAQTVLREVSEKYGLTVRQIQSVVRLKIYVLARQEASYRLNKELGFSLTQIGRMLGKRDHTTVLNAIQMYKKNLAKGDLLLTKKPCTSNASDAEALTQAQTDHG
jgi:hypothetical protein